MWRYPLPQIDSRFFALPFLSIFYALIPNQWILPLVKVTSFTAIFHLTPLASYLPLAFVMSISILPDSLLFKGTGGSLPIQQKDIITRQLAMLVLGECSDQDVSKVAAQFDYSRQRYYQLLSAYNKGGALALLPSQPGPKSNYRRTSEVVRRVIAQRFHDPEASAEVIAQKLRQKSLMVSQRSVERIIADYGLQKKTLLT